MEKFDIVVKRGAAKITKCNQLTMLTTREICFSRPGTLKTFVSVPTYVTFFITLLWVD